MSVHFIKRLKESKNSNVVLSSELFDLVRIKGIGVSNTPYTGLEVVSKDKARSYAVSIRLERKGFPEFNGTPVEYKYSGSHIDYGLLNHVMSDEEIREFISILEQALEFNSKIADYLKSY